MPSRLRRWILPALALMLLLVMFWPSAQTPTATRGPRANPSLALAPNDTGAGPFVSEAVTPQLSLAVRDLPPAGDEPVLNAHIEDTRENPRPERYGYEADTANWADPLLAPTVPQAAPTPELSMDGINNFAGVSPPDTIGAIGNTQYVQMVNATRFIVLNKNGGVVQAATNLSALWTSGNCAASSNGDPIVVYDNLANRWVLAQFSTGNGVCVAVSQTADATGAYYVYEFSTPTFPDYFKISVWPDAYYMGANESSYTAFALNRTAMLAGQAASYIRFANQTNFLMPASVDGRTAPPANSPGLFYTFKDNSFHGGSDRLEIFEFHADWVTPANSTFILTDTLALTAYDYTVCGFFVLSCIPQGGTSTKVDPVSEWPMWRLAYRNFGTHQALVGNFAVDVGSDRAGIRWFELRKTTGDWSFYQESTYAPGATQHYWMGSIAMDKLGNLALAYSVSNSSTFPALHYTIRNVTDPLNTLHAEATLINGTGSQTGSTRWGDYSALTVDPVDDCTFWFTSEYYITSSSNGWATRLGKFRIPSCSYAVTVTPPVSAQNGDPGTWVTYTVGITNTGSITDTYTVTVSGNAYTVTAPANIGPLNPSAAGSFEVVVAIPSDALAGTQDVVNVEVRSQGAPNQATSFALTTSVNAIYSVALAAPVTAQSGYVGEVVTYTVTLTNTGNYTDSFELTFSGNTFTTTAPANTGSLASGASTIVEVLVVIPLNATHGQLDSAKFNATSDSTSSASATVFLDTTALWYRTYLPLVRK